MPHRNINSLVIVFVTLAFPLLISLPVLAVTADVSQIQNFLRSIIQIITGLAGLIATGFFVVGGFTYITSSGNPEHLDRAKRTITWSAIGLAITIAAFVISNIVTSVATGAFG